MYVLAEVLGEVPGDELVALSLDSLIKIAAELFIDLNTSQALFKISQHLYLRNALHDEHKQPISDYSTVLSYVGRVWGDWKSGLISQSQTDPRT